MKKIMLLVVAIGCFICCYAQEIKSTVALQIVVEDMVDPFPAAGKAQMEAKLSSILTRNGVQSTNWQNQFFITAHVVPQTKDVLAGPPPQVAEVMDVVFYIGDSYNQIIFATETQTVRGVGTTDAKCYLNGLTNIKTNSTKLAAFVEEGRKKIIAYYDAQAPSMMDKARSLAQMHDYEQAIWMMMTIPSECKYYQQALDLGVEFYNDMLKFQCHQNLAAAKAAWMANYDKDGALAAAEYLSLIIPESGCYEDAETLSAEIKSRMREDYDFEIRKYEDTLGLKKDIISTIREIGVAYGMNQRSHTNLGFLRYW